MDSVGIKTGINTVKILNGQPTFPSFDYKISYNLGITQFYTISNLIGIQSDFKYIVKGTMFDHQNTEEEMIKTKWDVGYISLPLLLNIKPFEKLSIELGSDISYLLYRT